MTDSGPSPSTLTQRQQYWLDHIVRCDAAGSSTKDYASEHGLSVQAMYAARKALVERGALQPGGRGLRSKPAPTFARVVPAPRVGSDRAPAPLSAVSVQVHLTNGTVICFPERWDADGLRLLLQTAATLP